MRRGARLAVALAAIGVAAALAPARPRGVRAVQRLRLRRGHAGHGGAAQRGGAAALRPPLVPHARAHATSARAGRPGVPAARDFSLTLAGGAEVDSRAFTRRRRRRVHPLARGGLRVEMRLAPRPGGAAVPGLEVERAVEAYPGVAGFRSETLVRSSAAAGGGGRHARRGARVGSRDPDHPCLPRRAPTGASPDWTGPQLQVGDPHAGTWRDTRSRRAGAADRGRRRSGSRSRDGGALGFPGDGAQRPAVLARWPTTARARAARASTSAAT